MKADSTALWQQPWALPAAVSCGLHLGFFLLVCSWSSPASQLPAPAAERVVMAQIFSPPAPQTAAPAHMQTAAAKPISQQPPAQQIAQPPSPTRSKTPAVLALAPRTQQNAAEPTRASLAAPETSAPANKPEHTQPNNQPAVHTANASLSASGNAVAATAQAAGTAADPVTEPVQSARPDYAYNPHPEYPSLLRDQGVGGVVWLKVWVASSGEPGKITLLRGSGYRLLDDAALRAVQNWRFLPAKQGQQALASWVEFPIRFHPPAAQES